MTAACLQFRRVQRNKRSSFCKQISICQVQCVSTPSRKKCLAILMNDTAMHIIFYLMGMEQGHWDRVLSYCPGLHMCDLADIRVILKTINADGYANKLCEALLDMPYLFPNDTENVLVHPVYWELVCIADSCLSRGNPHNLWNGL